MNTSTPEQEVPEKTSLHILAYIGVWIAVMAWGASFVAARGLLYTETRTQISLSPTVLAALRFSVASLFFVVPLSIAIVRRQLSIRQLVQMFLLGQIAFSLYFWLQYTGVQKTNASISSILVVGLIPAVTAFLSQFIGKEHLSLIRFGALLLGFIGVGIIVLGHIHNRWSDILRLDATQWLALLFLSLGCSVIAYFVYNFALTKISASRAAVYIYFEPVVAVVLGITLLREHLSWQTLCGAVVIGASVVIVNLLKR